MITGKDWVINGASIIKTGSLYEIIALKSKKLKKKTNLQLINL